MIFILKEPLVSIIIPIYNSEKSIERCLCSIRNQTYKNIEVLMINDGSMDHTLSILHKYKKLDNRFRLINKINTGVSASRNQGINEARGEYLQFVDADDWIVKNATETYVQMEVTQDCDMVISDYYRVNGKKIYTKGHIPKEGLISREEFAQFMMEAPANFYYGVMWNKFFKTDIVRKQQITCSTDLNWCEDYQFNLEYLLYVSNIYVIKKPLYYYVKTKGSLVATQINFSHMIYTKKILFEYYKDLYKNIDIYKDNKFKIYLFFIAVARDRGKRKKQLS